MSARQVPHRQPALPRPCRQRSRCRGGDRAGAPGDPHRRAGAAAAAGRDRPDRRNDARSTSPPMGATASWCCRISSRRPTATPCRRAPPSWSRASIPGRRARSSRRATRAMPRSLLPESGGAIRFFFEEEATDQPVPLALNKIGHALHDLDPVFDRISRQPRLADAGAGAGLGAAAAAAVDVPLQAAADRRRGRLAPGRDLPAHRARRPSPASGSRSTMPTATMAA